MNPRLIMRRIERTLLGMGCIAGGCAALAWLLSNSPQLQQLLPSLESHAAADDAKAAQAKVPSDVTSEAISEADLAPKGRVVIPPGRPEYRLQRVK